MRRFEATEKTLDIIAITGTAFFSNPEAIHQIMERGVRIRVILLDHRPESLACLSVVRTCQKKIHPRILLRKLGFLDRDLAISDYQRIGRCRWTRSRINCRRGSAREPRERCSRILEGFLFVADDFHSLFERVRRGDVAATEQLIRESESDLRIIARAVLRDSQLRRVVDSMDICQSVLGNFFLRVTAGQYDIESPEALRALLGTMVRNKVIDQARKLHSQKRGNGQPVASFNEAIAQQNQPTPSEAVALQEIVSIAIKRLSDREREIVQRRNQGESWDAIATVYNCTPDAVRKQMKRGLDRVANELHLED